MADHANIARTLFAALIIPILPLSFAPHGALILCTLFTVKALWLLKPTLKTAPKPRSLSHLLTRLSNHHTNEHHTECLFTHRRHIIASILGGTLIYITTLTISGTITAAHIIQITTLAAAALAAQYWARQPAAKNNALPISITCTAITLITIFLTTNTPITAHFTLPNPITNPASIGLYTIIAALTYRFARGLNTNRKRIKHSLIALGTLTILCAAHWNNAPINTATINALTILSTIIIAHCYGTLYRARRKNYTLYQ